ncbi:MAG TPA: hypothetical protein PLR71_11275 [Deltaproteobacteria bacterium]|nr:hypothetical protein [Deltaproteobacteria bacterium]HQI82124.1 hypothetical protein [Deltaproteobacteria bacterium]
MRLRTAVVILSVLLAGCAHHGLRVNGDTVTLTLRAPHAGTVQFASSLDGFEPHPAVLTGGSVWEVSVPAGSQFSYFYLVDGEVYVPECAFSETDGFGSRDCIYVPGM